MTFRIFKLLTVLLFMSLPAMADELNERWLVRNTSIGLFETEEFAEIESTSQRYRETEERFESGIWKLAEFYKGMADHARSPYLRLSSLERLDEQTTHLIELYPTSAAAVIFRAELLNGVAWRVRGGGFAKDVDPDDWQLFNKKIRETIEFLEENREVGEADPQWYNLLSGAYWTLGDGNNATTIMLEGIEKFPGYYGLYFTTGLYLTPIWYGDAELLEGFANFAVERTQETEGTGLYARIYWSASASHYSRGKLFTESMVDWKKMKTSMFDVLERYPGDWNAQNFAYFSCLKGDAEMARQMFDQIGEAPISAVWQSGITFEDCRKFAGH